MLKCTVIKHFAPSDVSSCGTHEDERTVLYKTKSLDGTKPNTNPNPNPKLTQILTLFSCFMLFRARALSPDLQSGCSCQLMWW